MSTWRIDYTYECWKCPDRHSANAVIAAATSDLAVAMWRADLLQDFGSAHDYDLLVTDIRKENK